MIKYADESMFSELTKIWTDSFGDSEEYVDMFLEDNFKRIKTVVWEEQGRPVSVAYFLPMTYVKPQTMDKKACLYLYAAATLPEYRGKGFFGHILKFVKEHFSEPVLLVPGEPSLVAYYQKNGLTVCQKDCHAACQMEELTDDFLDQAVIEDISAGQYFSYREEALQYVSHMRWEMPFMTYICKENRYCGGRQLRISFEGKMFIAMIRPEEEKLHILELLSIESELNVKTKTDQKELFHKAVQILLQQTGCISAKVCIQPTVMCNDLNFDADSFYFNLTLG